MVIRPKTFIKNQTPSKRKKKNKQKKKKQKKKRSLSKWRRKDSGSLLSTLRMYPRS